MLSAINPSTSEPLWQVTSLSAEEMAETIERVRAAQQDWASAGFEQRAQALRNVATALRDNKHRLAELMAKEMGKPLHEGVAEVEKSAGCADHYAQYGAAWLADETLDSDASRSFVRYQPLGTLLGILPWNAPVWIAFRFLAPALMAGNTCVMKHDPHVPKSAEAIADVFRQAGVPDHVMANLPVTNGLAAEAIAHPAIAAVSFTGSSAAGGKIASLAAARIKPAVLELGGSDPFVVLADANLDAAADVAVLSRIINAGQSCIAAKRIIVERPVYKEFIELVATRLQALQVGDPLVEGTRVGPLAREDLRANLHRQVQSSIDMGAKCVLGGELPQGAGWFYPVTLLVDVTPAMAVAREETFGPVMAVLEAEDAEQALQLANDTDYGLGASVWSANAEQAARFANALEAGQVAINGIVKTDPRLPSGGIKRSGYGRELGPHGIKEFVNAKQIWVK